MACGCDSLSVKSLTSVEDALKSMLSGCFPVTETETIPLSQANGRVLAEAVKSQINVPPWDNSAMDGFAINSESCPTGKPINVSQRIPAGYQGTRLEQGTAARIFTGAPVPQGADTVVMQEMCTYDEQAKTVIINENVKAGSNIRKAGEDIEIDQEVVSAGTRLLPQHLGVIASVGVADVSVYRRLKVAIMATGDEITEPGKPLQAGKIYNSNKYTFLGLLQNLGVDIMDMGDVEDTFEATCDALSKASQQADIVLASGGVSVGEEDHVKNALEKLGKLSLWKMNIRPGKPLAFGYIDQTPFIGVPGNPVSLFVTFNIFARPFIQKKSGMEDIDPKPIKAKVAFDWKKPDKRREYVRVRRTLDEQGNWVLHAYPSRSSGVLTSVTWSDGIGIIPENTQIKKGDEIDFLPYQGLLD